MVTLHIYRKKTVRDNYYVNPKPIPVYVDDYHICDLKPGETTAVYVVPGPHKLEIKPPGFLEDPVTKEFTVDASYTDVYVAFRGRMGKYIRPWIFGVYQNNIAEFSGTSQEMGRVTFRWEDIDLKINVWYEISIDGQPIGIMDGKHPELAMNIPKGKHRVKFEELHEAEYESLDVTTDNSYVLVSNCKILHVQRSWNNPMTSNRQIKCVFTRQSQFAGCAATTKILIDAVSLVTLKNGETKAVLISEGKHSLLIKCNKIEVREIVVPENCSELYIMIENVDNITSITAK